MSVPKEFAKYEQMEVEQLPVPQHKLHGWTHFAGLYAANLYADMIRRIYEHPDLSVHLKKLL